MTENYQDRLNFITDLEEGGYSQKTIESLLEHVDQPENCAKHKRYSSAEEFFQDMEEHWDEVEDINDDDCNAEGVPIV